MTFIRSCYTVKHLYVNSPLRALSSMFQYYNRKICFIYQINLISGTFVQTMVTAKKGKGCSGIQMFYSKDLPTFL